MKKDFLQKKIKQAVIHEPRSDYILVIRPDKLTNDTLLFLQKHTQMLISYYFDAVTNIPGMREKISFFDEVYSFEKSDVRNFNLKFISNFIPFDKKLNEQPSNSVFNISSFDKRFPVLEAIARQLQHLDHPYSIMVKTQKAIQSNYVTIVENYLSHHQVREMIKAAGILLDIQKRNQEGLSFRVFEALGAGKKLITTNPEVKNYDFYDPNNILVISKKEPIIPREFLENSYRDVPEEIIGKYRRSSWISRVFKI